MPERRVFISYSTKDQAFARALAASLEIAGVEVLRDEDGIAVGDSIPEWIYSSLESATDVVPVMSTNSVASRWVSEELSAAKMRQKREDGFGIRPALIDDVELPMSLAHIRFADFRQWRSPGDFQVAVQMLLDALGVEPPAASDREAQWWLVAGSRARRSLFSARRSRWL